MEDFLVKFLWPVLTTASPVVNVILFCVVVYVLRDRERERDERISAQAEKDALVERLVNGLSSTTTAIKANNNAFESIHTAIGSLERLLERLIYLDRRNPSGD